MIITKTDIGEIRYTEKDPGELTESIRMRGVAIPVQVNRTEDGYVCTDGNRRLTACAALAEEDPKFRRVPICIRNDYSKSGSGYWGNTQNRH